MMPLLGSFRLLCFEFVIYIIAHVYVERNVQVGKGVRFINLIFEFVRSFQQEAPALPIDEQ